MTPAKITIEGDFWDCQIYRGRLYLWGSDGSLRVIDWYKLVSSFIESPSQELALKCAFMEGRTLYSPSVKVLFEDEEFRNLLLTRFDELTNRTLIITLADLDNFELGCQDNPFQELHTDSEILNNHIYALTYKGLFTADAHRSTRYKKKLPQNQKKYTILWDFQLKQASMED